MKNHDGHELERMIEILREHGLRLTHQRLEILRVLAADSSHPSVEQIYDRVVKRVPTISLDTVYRTITSFEKYGAVKRVEVLDDKSRFDTNPQHHHHLICKRCKRIEDFHWPAFDRLDVPDKLNAWGMVDSKQVEIRGLCSDCRGKTKRK